MKFRESINGLRALAVMAVALFHFNPLLLPGGFSGVDIFFVISGFLMTGIVLSRLEFNDFSIIKFYKNRAERIIPALIFMCIATLIFCWFFLSPPDFMTLGKHAASSVGFVSNFIYLGESGYFDTASNEKWLLHTWSLSAEWQFYLIYPLLLIAFVKMFSIKNLKWALLISTLICFVANLYFTDWRADAAYFLLPSRLWEMMLGGLAYCFRFNIRDSYTQKVEVLGVLLILASCVLISSEMAWPGYAAITPTLGAYLVIQANNKYSILRLRPIQLVGSWSFSIYLWHWPIVVCIHYFNLSSYYTVPGMALAIFLGFLSYRYVEKGHPFRFRIVGSYALLVLIIFSVKTFGYQLYNLPKNIWDIVNIDRKIEGPYTWSKLKNLNKIESFSDGDLKKVLIIGDSQAGDIVNALVRKTNKYEYVSRIVPAKCGIFFGSLEQINDYLSVSVDIAKGLIPRSICLRYIPDVNRGDVIENADYILIAMNWRPAVVPYVRGALKEMRHMTNAKIFLVGKKEFKETVPKQIYQHHIHKVDQSFSEFSHKHIDEEVFSINTELASISESLDITFINIIDIMCPNKKCNILDEQGYPLYYDKVHLNNKGASYLGDRLIGAYPELGK